jgi:hypothetical protein
MFIYDTVKSNTLNFLSYNLKREAYKRLSQICLLKVSRVSNAVLPPPDPVFSTDRPIKLNTTQKGLGQRKVIILLLNIHFLCAKKKP